MMIMILTHTETGSQISDGWQSDSEHHPEGGCDALFNYMVLADKLCSRTKSSLK